MNIKLWSNREGRIGKDLKQLNNRVREIEFGNPRIDDGT